LAAPGIQGFRQQGGDETALAGHRVNQAGVFQFLPGPFDRDHANAQLFGDRADGRQAGVTGQLAFDDLGADLLKDLKERSYLLNT